MQSGVGSRESGADSAASGSAPAPSDRAADSPGQAAAQAAISKLPTPDSRPPTPDSRPPTPRIDFYFGAEHRLQTACRVVRKARGAGRTVLVYARDADRLARFDAALWTFSALDFLPHVYADSPLAARTPIVLTLSAADAPARDVLLNLDDDPPPDAAQWFARFERVIEVVSQDDADRAAARARFKRYRDGGLAPNTIQVGTE